MQSQIGAIHRQVFARCRVAGGNLTLGTIVANTAVYIAPAVDRFLAAVTFTATSTADPAKSGSATATIVCANPISIAPSTANLALGQRAKHPQVNTNFNVRILPSSQRSMTTRRRQK